MRLKSKTNMSVPNGYIHSNPSVTQDVFGGISSVTERKLLQPDRNWEPHLPVFEPQNYKFFDSMSCVTFSALNCLEILGKRKFNLIENFSDRFTAKMSGTTRVGNTFYNVSNSIKTRDGLLRQSEYPNDVNDWEEFHKTVSEAMIAKAKEIFSEYNIPSEYVSTDTGTLWDVLQYGPVQVSGFAWESPVNGIFRRTNVTANHAFTLIGGEYGKFWKIFDSYEWLKGDSGIKKLAWDYRFWAGLCYNLDTLKPIEYMKFAENTLLQLVDAPGGFYLFAAGKLYKDDLSKLLASFMVRTKGILPGHVGTMTRNDLEGVKTYNLKGEEVAPF